MPRGGLAAFVRHRCPKAMLPGPILDTDGRVVGHHDGAARYTIGQRHGLGIGGGTPLYVTRVAPPESTVWVGPRHALTAAGLVGNSANWFSRLPEQFSARVQIRYRHPAVPAEIRRLGGGRFIVRFTHPVEAVTPGQAAVIYEDGVVLGGGWIQAPLSAESCSQEADII